MNLKINNKKSHSKFKKGSTLIEKLNIVNYFQFMVIIKYMEPFLIGLLSLNFRYR